MLIAAVLACHSRSDPRPKGEPALDPAVVADLSMTAIRDDVDRIAADETGGRPPGSPGHDAVRDYLADQLATAHLEPTDPGFAVPVTLHLSRPRLALDANGDVYEIPLDQVGANVLGLLPGTDPKLADQVVLLVAHYDHLGVDGRGGIFNGAFDDATAVCALLELARALDRGHVRFARTLGFLFTDAEEDGLTGAAGWVADPSIPLDRVAAALSVDPIGRPVLTDYRPLFTIGAERSPEITAVLRDLDTDTEVRRLSDAPVVGYASDQDVFWDQGVPALWITSGGMTFYHLVSDDPVTIDYRSVQEHLAAIAELAATLAGPGPRPTDVGPQPLSTDDLDQAVAVLDGALGSAELTDDERTLGEGYRATLARGASSADPTASEFFATYASLLLYVIQDLTPAHPGPIPPPFPE